MNRKIVRSDSANSVPTACSRTSSRYRIPLRLRDSAEFEAFASALVDDLDPSGPAEAMVAGRIALAAWRLHNRSTGDRPRLADERGEAALYRGLLTLDRLRAARRRGWGIAAQVPAPRLADTPIDDHLPPRREPDFASTGDSSGDDEPPFGILWRDRLVNDPEISEGSPVVKGTFVTVRHVVSLIVDGFSWSEILRDHPELTEADIRACLSYAVEVEGGSLPF